MPPYRHRHRNPFPRPPPPSRHSTIILNPRLPTRTSRRPPAPGRQLWYDNPNFRRTAPPDHPACPGLT